MPGVIQECSNPACVHEFQDKTYGKGRRVHNSLGKSGGKDHGKEIQCTVCLVKRENKNRSQSLKPK